jgi:hypothetical protein
MSPFHNPLNPWGRILDLLIFPISPTRSNGVDAESFQQIPKKTFGSEKADFLFLRLL